MISQQWNEVASADRVLFVSDLLPSLNSASAECRNAAMQKQTGSAGAERSVPQRGALSLASLLRGIIPPSSGFAEGQCKHHR